MAEPPKVTGRNFIFIDATLESQAPFFAQSPTFQTWLRCYNNIPDALTFITQAALDHSIDVYVARDNILDDGLPSGTNGQIRLLLDTLCDLKTVLHITIFCPTINTDLEQQIRSTMSDPRALKAVVSVLNLHSYMCREGIQCFEEQISHYIASKEMNLISNLQRNIDALMEYLMKVSNDRKKLIDDLQEEHSNKPGEEPL